MSRPLVSVVMATFERAHLLWRSLKCYENQDFDNKLFELVVVDDSSTDDTRGMVLNWSHGTGIRAVVLSPYPKYRGWRDCGAVLNYGIRASAGQYVLLTHPEVMPGRKSVAACVNELMTFERFRGESIDTPDGLYACCRVYYLSPRDQERIDSVNWGMEGALAVRNIPGFYEEDAGGHPDFNHKATDSVAQPGSRLATWESWVFGGCSRRTWAFLGGMLETQEWGSVDVAFLMRRRALGIPNHTCPEDDTICVHQSHDSPTDVRTDRDEAKWRAELKHLSPADATRLKYPGVDYLGWTP